MSHGARIAAAAAVAFLIVLIARFPARWATPALPHAIACTGPQGTIWEGSCSELEAGGAPLGSMLWRLHPLTLLAGRLGTDVEVSGAETQLSASVNLRLLGGGSAHDLRASLPLDRRLLTALSPAEHATLHIDLATLSWRGRRVTGIIGVIELRALTAPNGEPLGDYRLSFSGPASDEPIGRIEDLGGPLSVEGTLRLTNQPGFVVEALVAPRPGTPPDLTQALRYLGTPDAAGRREFSFAGNF